MTDEPTPWGTGLTVAGFVAAILGAAVVVLGLGLIRLELPGTDRLRIALRRRTAALLLALMTLTHPNVSRRICVNAARRP